MLHGLELDEPISLGRSAYLASYDAVREHFGLPEDPEPWFRERDEGLDRHPDRLTHASSRAVLVRRFNRDPAPRPAMILATPWVRSNRGTGSQWTTASSPWSTSSKKEGEILVHLLGVAVRSKLVSHTAFMGTHPASTAGREVRSGGAGGLEDVG